MPQLVDAPRSILDSYQPFSPDLQEKALQDAAQKTGEIRLTPEDGRYQGKLVELRAYVSEAELARRRLMVEAEWFRMLIRDVLPPELFAGKEDLTGHIADDLRIIADAMPLSMANRITEIEGKTRHDVIAMITALRENIESRLLGDPLESAEEVKTLLSYVHLGLTSEDVTSPSHTLMLLNTLKNVLQPSMQKLITVINEKAKDFSNVRDPDTKDLNFSLGARYEEYAHMLQSEVREVFEPDYLTVKFAGATGTHAALDLISREGSDPLEIAETFASTIVPGAHYLPVTAQINPHDDLSLWCGKVAGFCDTVVHICREIWEHSGRDVMINDELVKMLSVKPDQDQSGSSAMPQKVQVINIENAMGTAQSLAATARGLQHTLNVNCLQRRLSDSRQIREMFGDVLPKLLQIIQNMTIDVPKLIANEKCRTTDSLVESLAETRRYDDEATETLFQTDLRRALEVAAEEFADVPLLARTHNQPASPSTFGKELRVFAERLAYLEGVSQRSYRGRDIKAEFNFDEIQETAIGVVQQLLDDLRIYSQQRNGLLNIEHDDIDFSDPSRMREIAENLLCGHVDPSELVESFDLSPEIAMRELHAHYECLGEAIQTVLRLHGVYDAYEITKKVTRGAQMGRGQYIAMIDRILETDGVNDKIPADVASWLINLVPEEFTGKAEELACISSPSPDPDGLF
jgi:adenylosuccinate lyase